MTSGNSTCHVDSTSYCRHTHPPRSRRHRHRLLATQWQHSRSRFPDFQTLIFNKQDENLLYVLVPSCRQGPRNPVPFCSPLNRPRCSKTLVNILIMLQTPVICSGATICRWASLMWNINHFLSSSEEEK